MYLLAEDFPVPEIKSYIVENAKYFCNNQLAAVALKRRSETKLTLPQYVRWN